jgi:hypothetical protein
MARIAKGTEAYHAQKMQSDMIPNTIEAIASPAGLGAPGIGPE